MKTTRNMDSSVFWDRFREGHGATLDAVYRRYAPEVRAFLNRGFRFQSQGRELSASRLSAQGLDIDDLVQETFQRAFAPKARAAFDGVRPYRNYLFTVARNVALTALGQMQRTTSFGDVQPRDDAPTSRHQQAIRGQFFSQAEAQHVEKGAMALLEAEELWKLVDAFCDALDPLSANVFRRRFLDERPQQRVASELDIKRCQVRKLEYELRGQFQAYVQGTEYFAAYLPAAAQASHASLH